MRSNLKYSIRELARHPGYAILVVLSLALGIGASAAVFSITDALLLQSLPVPQANRLISLHTTNTEEVQQDFVPYALFERLRDANRSFSSIGASQGVLEANTAITSDASSSPSEQVYVERVSQGYFSTLGIRAATGRDFSEIDEDSDTEPVAVISFQYWQNRFGGAPDTLGKRIELGPALGNISLSIIGIAPEGFRGVDLDIAPDIWMLSVHEPFFAARARNDVDLGSTRVIGRLATGTSVAEAQTEVDFVYERLDVGESGIRVGSARTGFSHLRFEFSYPIAVLAMATALVFLIACTNAAGLLFTRGLARQRDFALRISLGSSRMNLLFGLVIEGVLLSLAGAVLGTGFAIWLTALIPNYVAAATGVLGNIVLNARLFAFVTAAAVLCVALVALAPGIRLSTVNPSRGLSKQSTPTKLGRKINTTDLIVIGQIALSVLMLIGSGLFLSTLHNLRSVDMGFDRRSVTQFRVQAQGVTGATWPGIVSEIIRQLESRSNVDSATIYSQAGEFIPSYRTTIDAIEELAVASGSTDATLALVGPGFFETTGISVVRGRDFREDDRARETDSPVAIVNESFVRLFYNDSSPIGSHVVQAETEVEIVGVAVDARHDSAREEATPSIYRLFPLFGGPTTARFAVRSQSGRSQLETIIVSAVTSADDRLRVQDIQTLEEVAESTYARERLIAHLVSLYGLIALALLCVGVYGVVSYALRLRSRDIAIRMALGARTSSVLGLVVSGSIAIVVAGIALGLLMALATERVVSSLLFGLGAYDRQVIVWSVLCIFATAFVGAYFPARRAVRLNSFSVLREL